MYILWSENERKTMLYRGLIMNIDEERLIDEIKELNKLLRASNLNITLKLNDIITNLEDINKKLENGKETMQGDNRSRD